MAQLDFAAALGAVDVGAQPKIVHLLRHQLRLHGVF